METTLQNILDMNYDDYVRYLISKYGPAQCDYFANEQCKSKSSKISRTKEGLFCHHIKENTEILLSTPEIAQLHPFEYQQKENLVYCNIIEHLLLHIKIVQEYSKNNSSLGIGGVSMITAQINGYYDHPPTSGWHVNAYNVIKDKYDDYIKILTYAVKIINDSENIFGFKSVDFCMDWENIIIDNIYQDLLAELQIDTYKNKRLYINDCVIVPKIGKSIIIAMLLPDGYDEPVMIFENDNGERHALLSSATDMIKVIEQKEHKTILYPGDSITDGKYGEGMVKDVAFKDADTIIITVLYKKYFCVYFNEVNNNNLVEAKKIVPKND
jgi:hypothetical protein